MTKIDWTRLSVRDPARQQRGEPSPAAFIQPKDPARGKSQRENSEVILPKKASSNGLAVSGANIRRVKIQEAVEILNQEKKIEKLSKDIPRYELKLKSMKKELSRLTRLKMQRKKDNNAR